MLRATVCMPSPRCAAATSVFLPVPDGQSWVELTEGIVYHSVNGCTPFGAKGPFFSPAGQKCKTPFRREIFFWALHTGAEDQAARRVPITGAGKGHTLTIGVFCFARNGLLFPKVGRPHLGDLLGCLCLTRESMSVLKNWPSTANGRALFVWKCTCLIWDMHAARATA